MKVAETSELISCPRCSRLSPSKRSICIYCGFELPLTSVAQLYNRQKLEPWEKGYNLVLTGQNNPQISLDQIESLIDIDPEDLLKAIVQNIRIPITRTRSIKEAQTIAKALETHGVHSEVIPDENLEKIPQRLRRIEFQEDKIQLATFYSEKSVEIRKDRLALIVQGSFFKKRIYAVEERKKQKSKPKESCEFDEDEIVADIYFKESENGYRILLRGFDFSTLGTEKRRLATENFPILKRKLLENSPEAKLVDDYIHVRKILNKIWQMEEKRNSIRWRRKSFGGYELESETLFSNVQQFTKYSNLQRFFLSKNES